MADNSSPRLCGGVFFTLLVEASKERVSAKDAKQGIHGETNDHLIMQRLVELGAEGYVTFDQEGFSKSVSKYKNCDSNYGEKMPFQTLEYIEYVDQKLTEDTDRALYLMSALLKKHFVLKRRDSSSPIRETARKILYVVDKDVPADATLLCGKHCKPIKKKVLVRESNIEIESFFLGVWKYILDECHDNKTPPFKNTLNLIYKEKDVKNDTGIYNPDFGKGSFTHVRFDMGDYQEAEAKLIITPVPKTLENDEYVMKINGEVVENDDHSKDDDNNYDRDNQSSRKYGSFTNNGIFIDTFKGDITYKGK